MRILFATLALIGLVSAQTPTGCKGVKNTNPVLDLPAQPLKTVPNGQSWLMKQDTNFVYIAKLSGTAYEMGKAYGQLYPEEIKANLNNIRSYGRIKLEKVLSKFGIPSLMLDYIYSELEPIIFKLLDLNWQIALPFIPQRYIDELHGMADGSGMDQALLQQVNMLPELIQAACTIVGSYGAATADGKVYHLRALDWESTAPVNQYPAVIIYEPTEEGSKVFANIGYLGLIGTLTAMSKAGISVGEKVMYAHPADYPVPPHITYYGKPWVMVLRDAAQFANNLQDVKSMFEATNRTMMVHLGFGSSADKSFMGVDYAANFVTFYNDKDYTHYSAAHPQMDGVFFYDQHVQPSNDQCVGNILTQAHGKINPETLYADVAGYHATGNAQVVVMDPEGQQIWASWSQYGAAIDAYERSPIHIRLSDFWATTTNFLE